jgi:hypothetical protein
MNSQPYFSKIQSLKNENQVSGDLIFDFQTLDFEKVGLNVMISCDFHDDRKF